MLYGELGMKQIKGWDRKKKSPNYICLLEILILSCAGPNGIEWASKTSAKKRRAPRWICIQTGKWYWKWYQTVAKILHLRWLLGSDGPVIYKAFVRQQQWLIIAILSLTSRSLNPQNNKFGKTKQVSYGLKNLIDWLHQSLVCFLVCRNHNCGATLGTSSQLWSTQVQLADFRMDGVGAWMVDGSYFKKVAGGVRWKYLHISCLF